jgi:hypothetical protein
MTDVTVTRVMANLNCWGAIPCNVRVIDVSEELAIFDFR